MNELTAARRRAHFIALSAAALVFAACHKQPKEAASTPSIANFTTGMVEYLKVRGDLCLGKQFPVDVTDREFETRARNAIQMPALEHAGLVTSSDAMGEVMTEDGKVPVKVRRYELTDAGQRYYLSREVPGQLTKTGQKLMRTDLCAAKLSLNKVSSFEVTPGEHPGAVVTYTYKVDAAPWMSEAEILQVFPAVNHVIAGAGSAELKEGFTLTSSGWIANELVPASNGAVANR
jgi:hypothetical protein